MEFERESTNNDERNIHYSWSGSRVEKKQTVQPFLSISSEELGSSAHRSECRYNNKINSIA